ncbi:hypothetical protein F5882DRAFT_122276 [Hyaloscypha sp. PMI_1271]|nr:hypothetical protein F5882DRAFT_122276 [Hyaloscypha sp. PMI_1271]
MVSLTAAGPAAPIPLVDGIEVPRGSTNDRKRLIWSSIPDFEIPEKCWNLQHKREGNEGWDDIYCFAEVECLPQDIGVMNWKSTKNVRRSFLNQMILCVRTVVKRRMWWV